MCSKGLAVFAWFECVDLNPEVILDDNASAFEFIEQFSPQLKSVPLTAPGHCSHPLVDGVAQGLRKDEIEFASQVSACVVVVAHLERPLG